MIRALTSLMLCLMLVVTSHSAALARVGDRAADSMVICVGAEAVVVYVDAKGQPTHAPHICPDCTVHGLDAGALVAPDLGIAPIFTHHGATAKSLGVHVAPQTPAIARAPPVLI